MKLNHQLFTSMSSLPTDGYLVYIQRNGDVTHIGPSCIRSHDCEYEPTGITYRISFDCNLLSRFKDKDVELAGMVAAMLGSDAETFKIKDVIYNDPAVIVKWADGTKTVAKAKDEPYDPEKGLAMCFAKKALGNTYGSFKPFKRALKKAPEPKMSDIVDNADSKPKRARKGGAK